MRNTRQAIVELLELKRDHNFELREHETNEYVRERALHMAIAYQEAIWFLTDEKYFKEIEDCFKY